MQRRINGIALQQLFARPRHQQRLIRREGQCPLRFPDEPICRGVCIRVGVIAQGEFAGTDGGIGLLSIHPIDQHRAVGERFISDCRAQRKHCRQQQRENAFLHRKTSFSLYNGQREREIPERMEIMRQSTASLIPPFLSDGCTITVTGWLPPHS